MHAIHILKMIILHNFQHDKQYNLNGHSLQLHLADELSRVNESYYLPTNNVWLI